jgi:hypothetical protein
MIYPDTNTQERGVLVVVIDLCTSMNTRKSLPQRVHEKALELASSGAHNPEFDLRADFFHGLTSSLSYFSVIFFESWNRRSVTAA